MKKIINKLCIVILTALVFLNVFQSYVYASQNYEIESNPKIEQPQNLCDQALLNMLFPYISDSVREHYGIERQFDLFDAKVVSIERPSEKYEFIIVVKIDTYTGAHNPPGGIVKITLNTSPYGTKVINFQD